VAAGMTLEEDNLLQVGGQIAEAAKRVSRSPEEITLVAVTKTIPVDRIQRVVAAGVLDLGENRAQELLDKYPLVQGPVRWHLIGSLQTNKVKYLIDKVYLIHSLDRWSLAVEIDQRAKQHAIQCKVLVQVNISGEQSKHGLPPGEAVEFIRQAAGLTGIKICGLMTMAPFESKPEDTRPVFRDLSRLAKELTELNIKGVSMEYLSMGMSNDYQVAVEEGATLVRVGSNIFAQH
jgi:pyridoxal phosphate enzyme (YggS family)